MCSISAGLAADHGAGPQRHPSVSIADNGQSSRPAQNFNPFDSLASASAFQAATHEPLPKTPTASGAVHVPQAASASPLQSGLSGAMCASEPVTPTGVPLRSHALALKP